MERTYLSEPFKGRRGIIAVVGWFQAARWLCCLDQLSEPTHLPPAAMLLPWDISGRREDQQARRRSSGLRDATKRS